MTYKTCFIPGPRIIGVHLYWRMEEYYVRITSIRNDGILYAIPPMTCNEFLANHFAQLFTISTCDQE